jgi:hypothetical protein
MRARGKSSAGKEDTKERERESEGEREGHFEKSEYV